MARWFYYRANGSGWLHVDGMVYRVENMDEALDMLDGIVSELVEKQEERGSKGEIKTPRKDVAMVGGRRSLQSESWESPRELAREQPSLALFVFPESEKHRRTQPIIPRPLGELDLANQRRFNPNTTLHFGGN
jgi:hypothetical protein